jgi:lipoprotein-anchoring transpeptidase ErfK/SrfK
MIWAMRRDWLLGTALAIVALVAPVGAAPAAAATPGSPAYIQAVQQRLIWAGLYAGALTGQNDEPTRVALVRFQRKFGLPVVLHADTTTYTKLVALTRKGGRVIDYRCARPGRALCADKTLRVLRVMENGKILFSLDARFGRATLPTREGMFTVYRRSRNHVSNEWGTRMPYALFFSGGQAVHYSYEFAAESYRSGSHGCINLRDRSGAAKVFAFARAGTRVVVYRS